MKRSGSVPGCRIISLYKTQRTCPLSRKSSVLTVQHAGWHGNLYKFFLVSSSANSRDGDTFIQPNDTHPTFTGLGLGNRLLTDDDNNDAFQWR
jgi:hypothetical protein